MSSAEQDYIYTDVGFRQYKRERIRKIVLTGLFIGCAITAVFLPLAIFDDRLVPSLVEAFLFSSCAFLLGRFYLSGQEPNPHIAFAIFFVYLWGAIIFSEGIIEPHHAVNHYWFLVFNIGSLLIFQSESKYIQFTYTGIFLTSFVVVEAALITIHVREPIPEEHLGAARLAVSILQFISVVLLCRLFILDIQRAENDLTTANLRLEDLVENMLPKSISNRLRQEGKTFADGYTGCSVLFADIVGFTPLAAKVSPNELVKLLDSIFSKFDVFTEELRIEKIKTIGDAYMAAAGLPEPNSDHAIAIVELALKIRSELNSYADLSVRIGINSGEVVAGIIGKKRFIYDLWGDTVNIASRMESHGLKDEIQISESTYELVNNVYQCEKRGVITVKGRGEMPVYIVKGRKI